MPKADSFGIYEGGTERAPEKPVSQPCLDRGSYLQYAMLAIILKPIIKTQFLLKANKKEKP